VTGTNVNATRETGEPNHIGSLAHSTSVWWSLTAGAAGQVTLTTCGSSFDTVLAVYTGTTLSALSSVASNDDSALCGSGSLQSALQFTAAAGTAYQIAVTGFNAATGSIVLNATFPAGSVATTTTLSGSASALVGQSASYTATVTAASGTPSGTVSFRRGGVQFATGTLNGSGVATASASDFPIGTHQITAVYLATAGFATSTSSAVTTVISAVPTGPVEFRGGGAVFGFTSQCAPAFEGVSQPVRIRYAPSELNRVPSEVSLTWPTGSEHLALAGPLVPSALFGGGAGRQMWTRFLFYPTRPLIRVVQRQITLPPAGSNLALAEEVLLRLRVQNFAAIAGCSVTIAATLRRT
jgi:hypothetical protein